MKSQDNDLLLVRVTTQGNLYMNFDDSEKSLLSILTTLTKVDKEHLVTQGQGKTMIGMDKHQQTVSKFAQIHATVKQKSTFYPPLPLD